MRCIVLSCVLLLAVGCASTPIDPVQRMTDTTRDPGERVQAAEQARQQRRDDPQRIAALHRLVWDRGHPHRLRQLAIDHLIEYDEADFKQAVSRRIVLIQNWDTLVYLLDTAAKRNWTDLTPAIVRNYARPASGITDEQRPERQVLLTLNPGRSIEQIVFDVFADVDDQVEVTQQVGAWELLCRTTPKPRLMELLAAAADSTPLVIDLKACAAELGTVPTNREGVLWLSALREPGNAEFWNRAAALVGDLGPQQREGLELRHLPVLLEADAGLRQASRSDLLRRAQQAFAGGEHYTTGPTYDGPMRDYPQRFHEAADKLCWADLAAILTLHRALQQPQVVQALFEQAEADRRDPGSEHGGLLVRHSTSAAAPEPPVAARAYLATMRDHDRKFIAPDNMVRDMYTALAHYHFHAQEHQNSNYAGPGVGDLKLANRLNCNGLVFTFIDARTLNVDYYQPNGAVVDLGVLRR